MKDSKDINQFDDEIDLNFLLRIFLRNKKLIIFPAILISFGTAIFTLIAKPIWSGNFTVLVKNQESKSTLSSNPIVNILQNQNNISDEAYLLKTPFVLQPVFEYIKKTKKLNNDYTFNEWITGPISVEASKDSNIIKVSYEDENKEFILNVLGKITEKYKKYSISKLNQDLDRQIKFLSKQEKIYERKYLDSLKTFNKFSIKNGLGDIDGFVKLGKRSGTNNGSLTLIGGDQSRNNTFGGQSINNSFNPQNQLNPNNATNLQNQVNNNETAGQRYTKQFDLLETLETKYARYSSLMTEESEYLRNLKLQIDTLESSLKRPNQILVKYKELQKTLSRNENIYTSIESNLINLKIERAKDKKTWDIISNPTIEKYRVSPKRKKNVAISFLISILFFYFVSIIKERKSNIVFELNELKKLINIEFKEILDREEFNFNNSFLTKLTSNNESVFLKGSKLMKNDVFKIFFKDIIKIEDIKLCHEIDYKKNKNIFLFIEEGKITKKDIININRYVNLNKELFAGWIYLEK
ncbi:GumC family protein [Prochlorococcus marinus]|nr:Wzz/FepE/Etk N-terminal domain-containing protein [Prochlorococcus marinus]